MTAIDINPSLSRTLSAEHQCLAAQIKIIEDIMEEPQYEAHRMLVALRTLIELAQEHFAHEEESMIDTAFPGMLLHRRDHEYLLKGLRDYISAFVDITDRPPPSLCDNLQSWLGFHCRRYDDAHLRFAEQRPSSASIIWRPHS